MNAFTQSIDHAKAALARTPIPARGRKDPQWDPYKPIGFVWERLLTGSWPLSSIKELTAIESDLRAVFAYALDADVHRLEYVRTRDLLLPQAIPSWIPLAAREQVAREMSFAFAAAVDTGAFAKRLQLRRSVRMCTRLDALPAQDACAHPDFRAAVWYAFTRSHAAAGMIAADMLIASLREYSLHLATGEWETAGVIRQFIEVFPFAIPIMLHPAKSRTLLVLCADD